MEEMIEPIEQKTKEPKLFKWALWWGLGIVMVCLTILLINGESLGDLGGPMIDALYRRIYQFGLFPVILYIGLVGGDCVQVMGKREIVDWNNIPIADGFICCSYWMVGVFINTVFRSHYTHLF